MFLGPKAEGLLALHLSENESCCRLPRACEKGCPFQELPANMPLKVFSALSLSFSLFLLGKKFGCCPRRPYTFAEKREEKGVKKEEDNILRKAIT